MKIIGNTITVQKPSLALKGGIMAGSVDMNNHILNGISTPTEEDHAVNKEYADNIEKNAKKYSDDKYLEKSVTLTADGWTGDDAPYTQTVAVNGILADDDPHYTVVYSGDLEAKLKQKEAFAMVDDMETAAGSVTFTCLEDKPEVDLLIQMEVNR